MGELQRQITDILGMRSGNNSPNLVVTPPITGFGSQPAPQYGNTFCSGHIYPPPQNQHQHLPAGSLPYAQGIDPALQPVQRAFHHLQGKLPLLTPLTNRFPALHPAWIHKIANGSFDPGKDAAKMVDTAFIKAISPDETADVSNLRDLLRSQFIYSQVVAFFAHPATQLDLQNAFVDYQLLLLEKSILHTFASLKAFHIAFVFERIMDGQDIPDGWRRKDSSTLQMLERPDKVAKPSYPQGPASSSSVPSGICRKFNKNQYKNNPCRYAHICSKCSGPHSQANCPSATAATSSNSISLDGRISRPTK